MPPAAAGQGKGMAVGTRRDHTTGPVPAPSLPRLPDELQLRTARLVLEPVTRAHHDELAQLTADEQLWQRTERPRHLGRGLATWLAGQESRLAPTGSAWWLTWVLRPVAGGPVIGQLQATVVGGQDGPQAELSWLVAVAEQNAGLATEAGRAVVTWLGERLGVTRVTAHVGRDHAASEHVATSLGLVATGEVVDGERLWSGAPPRGGSSSTQL